MASEVYSPDFAVFRSFRLFRSFVITIRLRKLNDIYSRAIISRLPIIDHRCWIFKMRFFIAGIMQGSHTANHMHDQDYRQRIAQLLEEHFPALKSTIPWPSTRVRWSTIN